MRFVDLLFYTAIIAVFYVRFARADSHDDDARAALSLALASQPQPKKAYAPDLPPGCESYQPARHTQSIYRLDSRPRIDRVSTDALEAKYRVSGGMVGVRGWRSAKFRLLPRAPRYRIALISVKNSYGYMQEEQGIVREYADGTRFDDVLSSDAGVVFEHRVREKQGGRWTSSIAYKDESARPKGYAGLSVSCASCHGDAGSGGYAVGLVPGGDTVISDPMDWSLVAVESPGLREEFVTVQSALMAVPMGGSCASGNCGTSMGGFRRRR